MRPAGWSEPKGADALGCSPQKSYFAIGFCTSVAILLEAATSDSFCSFERLEFRMIISMIADWLTIDIRTKVSSVSRRSLIFWNCSLVICPFLQWRKSLNHFALSLARSEYQGVHGCLLRPDEISEQFSANARNVATLGTGPIIYGGHAATLNANPRKDTVLNYESLL